MRGKILNAASATADKLRGNKELSDLLTALGCGTGRHYKDEDLRYDKVVIMTDADVDGAHIAALLMTYFYREMKGLIDNGHLYLAQPPLFRVSAGAEVHYAKDEADRDRIIQEHFKNRKVEVGRFKGLGEMSAKQLKETTMDPKTRVLEQIRIDPETGQIVTQLVDELMGRKPELRLAFIQNNAELVKDLDV